MKITIESTSETEVVDGRECRVWKGVTEKGTECLVLIHRVLVDEGIDPAEFDEALVKKGPPAWQPAASA